MHILETKKHRVGDTYDRAQFNLLMQCSEKCDMTEWNTWRQQHPNQPVLLHKANLDKAFLRGADLRHADFRGASLRGVDLSGFRLPDYSRRWADLSGADFREADLCLTDFRGANLRGANFARAYLYYTNLSWTDLSGANFDGADLWGFLYEAVLRSVDLGQANRRIKDFIKIGCKFSHQERSNRESSRKFLKAVPGNGFDITVPSQVANQQPDPANALIRLAA